ncbi:hypothetical protein WMY93_005747 [Mugilogobius chulae]|uniref:Uncharacterized protein n=1 Tax=Mugilogobius chulae TaxID=88201 RepID=A0AAW0PKM1_9GOBI
MELVRGLQFLIFYIFLQLSESFALNHLQFAIEHTWDSNPVDHEPIKVTFSPGEGGLKMQVFGPFFNDPASPPGPLDMPFLVSGIMKQQLPMVFTATVTENRWIGEALIPWGYFPPNINKMNSYAIHGSDEKRTYEALYSIPKEEIAEGQQPNFHLLQYFQDFTLQSIMGADWVQPESELWKGKP